MRSSNTPLFVSKSQNLAQMSNSNTPMSVYKSPNLAQMSKKLGTWIAVSAVASLVTGAVVYSVQRHNRKKKLIEKISKAIKENPHPRKSLQGYDILYECPDYAISSDKDVSDDAKIYYLDNKIYEEYSYDEGFLFTTVYTKRLPIPKYAIIYRSSNLDDVIAMYAKHVT